ncbi:MAG: Ni/Fe hydrogenase subunit alpha [Elusimicrobia bacterium]|nr:Ni/Fe hydrogenase subunit alpha [Elusimicrobiota bacterium]
MAEKITINPVTRIEGHAKITLQLGDDEKVKEALFHVNEFRGFEKFCEGRFFTEMPTITPRICGICPVSHAVASAKACEDIMRLKIPPAGDALRKLIHLGQIVSSHALSFFHLTSPDLLMGWDADPASRNILAVAGKFPDLARRGIRLRKFGQEISERVTGKKIHSIGIAAGGMLSPLLPADRRELLNWIPEALETAKIALDLINSYQDKHPEMRDFATFDSLYLGTVGPRGEHELYDGKLRFVDEEGAILLDQADPARYLEFIAETPVSWSYLKYPCYRPRGAPRGHYRVGPLARLNVAARMTTPLAQVEFAAFKQKGGGRPVHGTFFFHHARLIELLSAVEQIHALLDDPLIESKDVFAKAARNQNAGIGSTEAPRGTLFHHYTVDDNGVLTKVNLLIATGQNNPGMNRSILEVAKAFVDGRKLQEGALNRVEGAIRCYDPCLSCSTHAIGAMPLEIELVDAAGAVVDTVKRGL